MKKNNSIPIIIAIGVLLVIACILGIFLALNTPSSKHSGEVKQALKYYASADYDNAIIKYEEILRKDDTNEDAYEGIARALCAKNDLQTALQWLNIGIEKTKSDKLQNMLNDLQHRLAANGGSITYSINEVMENSQDVDVYTDVFQVLYRYTYGDYAKMYTFSDESTEWYKIINEIPVRLWFDEPPTDGSKPYGAMIDDLSYVFTGIKKGLSYERLSQLDLKDLKLDTDAVFEAADHKENVVTFWVGDCCLIIESDENGNIVKKDAKCQVLFRDRYVTGTFNNYGPPNTTPSEGIASDTPNENPDSGDVEPDEKTHIFKGFVKDAETNSSAGKVHMEIYEGKESAKGKLIEKLDTNTGGDFQTNLAEGIYSVVLEAKGYIKLTEEIEIHSSDSVYSHDFKLSKVNSSAGMLRFVLTWGSQPSDIDSHLIGTTGSGTKVHSFYGKKTVKDSSGNIVTTLDIDQMRGNGREETILYNTDGTYTFYVDNYSGDASLGESGAVIKIYEGDSASPAHIIEIPANFNGDVWAVCRITDGNIEIINDSASKSALR